MTNEERAGYSRQEMMAIATGREIRDGELAIFGVGLSMLAGYFAKACHAPNVRAMTEGGVYGASPVGGLPCVGDRMQPHLIKRDELHLGV